MKRFFLIGWAFYMLFLAILPKEVKSVCTAAPEKHCCQKSSETLGNTCSLPTSEREHECDGTCNPFQQCGCCYLGFVADMPTYFHLPNLISIQSATYPIQNQYFPTNFLKRIWQPPRAIA